jgi:hypothetical protein
MAPRVYPLSTRVLHRSGEAWSSNRRFLALLVVVGILLSFLGATAARLLMLLAYDVMVGPSATTRGEGAGSLRREPTVTARKYLDDAALVGDDDASSLREFAGAGAACACDDGRKHADGCELRVEVSIHDEPAAAFFASEGTVSLVEGAGAVPSGARGIVQSAPGSVFHYTTAENAAKIHQTGLWSQSSATDVGTYTAQQAVELLGVKTPPNVVIEFQNADGSSPTGRRSCSRIRWGRVEDDLADALEPLPGSRRTRRLAEVRPRRSLAARFRSCRVSPTAAQVLSRWGPGSRAIVWGTRGTAPGHAFNVVNQGGTIRFLDGQTGGAAVAEGFESYYVFRTTQ